MRLIRDEITSWSLVLPSDKVKLQDDDHNNVMISPTHVFLYTILMLVTGMGAFDVDIPLGVGFDTLSMVRDCNSLPLLISCLVEFILVFDKFLLKFFY